jgi:hypothetical protein
MVEGRDGLISIVEYNTCLQLITHALHEEGWDELQVAKKQEKPERVYSELVAAGEGDGESRHVNR